MFKSEKSYSEKAMDAYFSYKLIKNKDTKSEIDNKLLLMIDEKILMLFKYESDC